jgi:outer membrane lipoprotein SlyB
MKKLIPFLSFAIFAVACNSAPKPGEDTTSANNQQSNSAMTSDTTGLSQFQSWKAQHELASTNTIQQAEAQQSAPTPRPQNRVVYNAPVKHSSRTATASTPRTSTHSTDYSGPSTSSSNDAPVASTGSGTSESPSTAPAEQKKTISKSVKGAVIGGVAGGVAGAVINKKNRVAGGVIGAVLGAGGGWILGKQMDKKDQANQEGRNSQTRDASYPMGSNSPFPIKF